MKIYLTIAISTIKMYFRKSQSLFWSLFFPVVMMLGLGFFGFGQFVEPKLGIIDKSNNPESIRFIDELSKKSYIEVEKISELDLEKMMLEGKIDVALIIENDFKLNAPNIEISFENSKEKIANEFYDISQMVIDNMLKGKTSTLNISLKEQSFDNENQGYKGFLVPGIVALSIMQSGILGVVFTLISYKTQGVLKRLQATPISPSHFLIGQMLSRLLIIVIQTFLLFFIGVVILDINIALGNIFAWINIIIFSILGSILFLLIGLAISGASPNEDYAAPIANLVTFPMMFLSGVFFKNDILPGWIGDIANMLPLSPLVNSLRESALYGTNTLELVPELIIIIVWIFIAFIVGIKTFKWE
ncbi:MAG: ABC transporter permease [Chloroflexota bacterium]|nr:ABC transporter permease [Chloroflexota bacterium]